MISWVTHSQLYHYLLSVVCSRRGGILRSRDGLGGWVLSVLQRSADLDSRGALFLGGRRLSGACNESSLQQIKKKNN